LVNQRSALHCLPRYDRAEDRRLSCQIKALLKVDRTACTTAAGTAIEVALADGDLWEAWAGLKAWYRHAGNPPNHPGKIYRK